MNEKIMKKRVCILDSELFFYDFFIHGGTNIQFEYKILSLAT
jgi:hypothetical protein